MHKIRLMIVDDEEIRSVLSRALTLLGYNVTEVASGEEALACLGEHFYQVMIVDMQLPSMSGMEVISLTRKKWPNVSIIAFTRFASLENAVAAFKLGVVDYLQKTATLDELLDAVARAVHKREMHLQKTNLAHMLEGFPHLLSEKKSTPVTDPPVKKKHPKIVFARPLLLNRAERSVKFVNQAERVVKLTRGETAVLYTLMSHPDQVLSCQQLVQGAWGYETDKKQSQSLIRPYISRLRHKLEETPTEPQLICTVRSRGYVWVSAQH